MTLKEKTKGVFRKTYDFFTSGSALSKIVIAIIFIIIVMLIVHCMIAIYHRIHQIEYRRVQIHNNQGSPTFCPKQSAVFQGKNLHWSQNELGGSEYSYTLWLYVNDWSYKPGQWKSIFHKGNSTSWPNRAPGVWCHPDQNTIRVYMNTFESPAKTYIDIPNIPIQKWFHMTITMSQTKLDVFVNGSLRKSHKFTSIPRQNYGDLYIMQNRGFDGFITKFFYFDYVIPYSEIEGQINEGPGNIVCGQDQDIPPYFANNWWVNNNPSKT